MGIVVLIDFIVVSNLVSSPISSIYVLDDVFVEDVQGIGLMVVTVPVCSTLPMAIGGLVKRVL